MAAVNFKTPDHTIGRGGTSDQTPAAPNDAEIFHTMADFEHSISDEDTCEAELNIKSQLHSMNSSCLIELLATVG